MFSYISLPTSAPTDLFAATGSIFSDIWVLIALAVGIPLAFFIIDLIISLVYPEHAQQYTDEELDDISHGVKK
jgi:hypothetical protein